VNVVEVESLEDIAAMEPEDLRTCVKDIEDINVVLQTSRLRQAWEGIKKAAALADEVKRKSDDNEDLDALLPREILESGEEKFWALYHMKWHAAVEPSEYLISKCARRLVSRTMAVDNLWHVKTLATQFETAPKRQKVKEWDRQIEATDDMDIEVLETVTQYLANIFTYCLAWARAGCDKLDSAPSEFKRTVDTASVINVPLDIMMAYHDRAKRMSYRRLQLPGQRSKCTSREQETLTWLIGMDKEERAAWAEQFRDSDLTFGQVVQRVMRQTETNWVQPMSPPLAVITTSERSGGQAGKGVEEEPKSLAEESSGGGVAETAAEPLETLTMATAQDRSFSTLPFETVDTMSNGASLCAAYNKGRCSEWVDRFKGVYSCSRGQHLCNAKCRNGRACGFDNHISRDCRNPKAIHRTLVSKGNIASLGSMAKGESSQEGRKPEPKWKAKQQWEADRRDGGIRGHVEEPAVQEAIGTGASSSSKGARPSMPAGPPSARAEDEQRPAALDLMSGESFPLGRALTWCGWHAESYDILLNKEHNMLDEATQTHLLGKVATTDLTFVSQDCETLSRFRENQHGIFTLRGEAHVKGLPGLSEENQRRLDDANALVEFTCKLIKKAVENENGFALETPSNSWLWQLLPLMKDTLRKDQYIDTCYATCSSGGARKKMQTIRHNIEEFKNLESECHHEHDRQEWAPVVVQGKDGGNSWWYPHGDEREYTAVFVFQVAVAASSWAVRMGRAKLKIYRTLPANERGDRKASLAWTSETLRNHAMGMVAFRVGIGPRIIWGVDTPKKFCVGDYKAVFGLETSTSQTTT